MQQDANILAAAIDVAADSRAATMARIGAMQTLVQQYSPSAWFRKDILTVQPEHFRCRESLISNGTTYPGLARPSNYIEQIQVTLQTVSRQGPQKIVQKVASCFLQAIEVREKAKNKNSHTP